MVCQSEVIYKPVQGFPGYRVGDDGSVWSCWKRKRNGRLGIIWFISDRWIELKQHRCGGSLHYLFVALYNRTSGVVKKQFMIHRLVLEVFTSKQPREMQCRHLNGNPHDNHLSNLAWGTALENARDKEKHRRERRDAKFAEILATPWLIY